MAVLAQEIYPLRTIIRRKKTGELGIVIDIPMGPFDVAVVLIDSFSTETWKITNTSQTKKTLVIEG